PPSVSAHPSVPTPVKPSIKPTPQAPTMCGPVVRGDSLWGLAGKFLGSGTKWRQIYDANRSTIEAFARDHGFPSSDTGHWIFPGVRLGVPGVCAARLASGVTPTPTQPPVAPPCPAWEFIGVKGVANAPAPVLPFKLGPNVPGMFDKVISELQALHGKENVGVSYVNYDPSPETVFNEPEAVQAQKDAQANKMPKRKLPGSLLKSEEQGRVRAIDKLKAESSRCPDTHFILAGYSEGAWVLGDALADPQLNAIHDRIDSVLLFGDPRFDPDSPAAKNEAGGQPADTVGLAAYADPPGKREPYLPKDLEGRAQSYCSTSPVDPVCTSPKEGVLDSPDWGNALGVCRGEGFGLIGRTGVGRLACGHINYGDAAARFVRDQAQGVE
ncbi:cutinase family protein, partial [Streptomyces sp. NPDC054834]